MQLTSSSLNINGCGIGRVSISITSLETTLPIWNKIDCRISWCENFTDILYTFTFFRSRIFNDSSIWRFRFSVPFATSQNVVYFKSSSVSPDTSSVDVESNESHLGSGTSLAVKDSVGLSKRDWTFDHGDSGVGEGDMKIDDNGMSVGSGVCSRSIIKCSLSSDSIDLSTGGM